MGMGSKIVYSIGLLIIIIPFGWGFLTNDWDLTAVSVLGVFLIVFYSGTKSALNGEMRGGGSSPEITVRIR